MKILLKQHGKETIEIDCKDLNEVTIEGSNLHPSCAWDPEKSLLVFHDLDDYERLPEDLDLKDEDWPCEVVVKFNKNNKEFMEDVLSLYACYYSFLDEKLESRWWKRFWNFLIRVLHPRSIYMKTIWEWKYQFKEWMRNRKEKKNDKI